MDGILVRLPERAMVVGPRISFGEIADVIGPNRAVLEKIRRIDLGMSASAGRTIKITQGYVKIVLRREGYFLKDFVFEGAQTTEVLTKRREISTEDLLPEAKAFILKEMKESPENVKVNLVGVSKKIFVPAGEIKSKFRGPLSGRYEGILLLSDELEVDGRVDRVLPLRVMVDVLHLAVVTTKKIEKGEKLSSENVALVRMPASKIPSDTLRQLESVLGRTAAFSLAPETAIRISYLYDPPVIKRGQKALAIVQKGNIEMTVEVIAIEDGKAGDIIRVENTDTHKAIHAKVRDEKTVLIEERP